MDDEDEKKTIEEWATAKGLLPAFFPVKRPGIGNRDSEGVKANPKHVLFTMAKAHRQWPEGREVTEEEFDAAVKEAGEVSLR